VVIALPQHPPSLKLISIRDAAEYAKVSTTTVRRWIKSGALRTYRAGRQIRIDEADLIACLSAQ
jgi:excisionase family DNA binding protein